MSDTYRQWLADDASAKLLVIGIAAIIVWVWRSIRHV
jgi:hypothetical protein